MKTSIIVSAMLACLAFLPLQGVQAGYGYGSACQQSARDMSKSCYYELGEEYNATIANCRQFENRDDRDDCYRTARGEWRENLTLCGAQYVARKDTCALLSENYYSDPLADTSIDFIDPDDIGPGGLPNNPYVILQTGHTHVLKSEDEIVVVHATDDSREIGNALCRVVVDIVIEEEFDSDEGEWEYTAIEVTDDWFAQDSAANVYYCGEVARNYEDGVLRDIDGSFESGLDFAKGGKLTLAMPAAGMAHRQEYALGEAEDVVQYLAIATSPDEEEGGDNEAFPCEDACLKTFDFAPLEPESTEYKYYLPGVGFVLALGLEDGELTGDREELVCVGDSLEVLGEESCGIEDPEALLEELCELHGAFCE
ncbi:MAG: hypothetical protein R3E82_04110 [Pseudomonadales bacterium]|nr:hypothetical protein [Pseudomonadales bacterium]